VDLLLPRFSTLSSVTLIVHGTLSAVLSGTHMALKSSRKLIVGDSLCMLFQQEAITAAPLGLEMNSRVLLRPLRKVHLSTCDFMAADQPRGSLTFVEARASDVGPMA